jgi:hypothetical protein
MKTIKKFSYYDQQSKGELILTRKGRKVFIQVKLDGYGFDIEDNLNDFEEFVK